jgi:transcription initiation factor TFIIB
MGVGSSGDREHGCEHKRVIRDYDRGISVCSDCGIVTEERVFDIGPEWRAFDTEQMEKRCRVGAPTTEMLHDRGLPTTIDPRNIDGKGSSLGPKGVAKARRLRKMQQRYRIANSSERGLAMALSMLETMSSNMSIANTEKISAVRVYRVIRKMLRGRPMESVVATALYIACREEGLPRTLDEFAQSGADKKMLLQNYKSVVRRGLKRPKISDPSSYVPRFASSLGVRGEISAAAQDIIKRAARKGLLSGHNPKSIVGAALCLAIGMSGKKPRVRNVARAISVTDTTIRNGAKRLAEKLNLKID